MENATDAIIMATSVLLLIIALSVSISSLSNLKTQVQDILSQRDEVDLSTYSVKNGETTTTSYNNYIKNNTDIDVRKVNAETIITLIRRMRKENYTIYIKRTYKFR